jgi:hypothetical protein
MRVFGRMANRRSPEARMRRGHLRPFFTGNCLSVTVPNHGILVPPYELSYKRGQENRLGETL